MAKKKIELSNQNLNLKDPVNKPDNKLCLSDEEEKLVERMMNYVKIMRPDKFKSNNEPE